MYLIRNTVLTLLLIMASVLTAQAQTVVAQVAHSDDGYVWVENPTSAYQQFSVAFYNYNGHIQTGGGSLAPNAYLVPVTIPSGAEWAEISAPALGYINFTGNRLYGTALQLGSVFFAEYYTGIAIVNPQSFQLSITLVLYDQFGNIEDSYVIGMGAYSSFAMYAHQWFSSPSIDWNQPHLIGIGASQSHAILTVVCDPATWTCEQT